MSTHGDDTPQAPGGIRRRGFLGSLGGGVVGAAVVANAAQPETRASLPGEPVKLTLNVNGRRNVMLVQPRWTLLYVLRDKLGITGTKVGCERGECGACTVLVDGTPRYACMTLALEAEGREITTIEGLMQGEQLGPVQQAFVEQDGMQCGYCTPGQVLAAEGLLRKNPNPTPRQVREGMSGNLCRCAAYDHIFKSVRRAAELRKEEGGAA
ncbi:MAG TPA: (2Fe-2S)-binding protein [Bryobacteraceae bacterium]|nr:(2Fe-2S)-binding protein [Bryobacteraceae bacterium]